MSTQNLFESSVDPLNDLFLEHQIHSLRLSDQKTFLDALASLEENRAHFHVGDYVEYHSKRYWIETIEKDDLLLKNETGILFKKITLPGLKKLKGNRLLDIAEKVPVCEDFERQAFYLRQTAFELRTRDLRKYAALKGSGIQILPHQIQAVEKVIHSLGRRFLIADEVGLGKTIETGLIIKEFSMRYRARDILVVTPASILLQWQNELREKFSENFTVLDRKSVSKEKNVDIWLEKNPRVLVSLDFARQAHVTDALARKIWDLSVFDEAHRLRRDRSKTTRAWELADKLSLRSKSLLLLSATPFSGKIEELYFFLCLLDRNKLGSLHSFMQEYRTRGGEFLGERIREVAIRRTKKEVGGFTLRKAVTMRYRLTPKEQVLYDQLSDYVKNEYQKALAAGEEAGNRGSPRALMLVFFQKMMDSSWAAIRTSLEKRVVTLETTLSQELHDNAKLKDAYEDLLEDLQSETEEEEEKGTNRSSQESTIADLKAELSFLKGHLSGLKSLKDNTKAEALQTLLRTLWDKDPNEKIIIFTQFKSTLFSLRDLFPDVESVLFYGSLSREDKDKAIEIFKHKSKLLLCTEAGGEGRNLQFSRILINYDLPWNPFRIEQRIGRIHRFGQKKDVIVYNFAMEASIGERILEILTEKIKIFEDAFGETEQLLGMVEEGGADFEKLFARMMAGEEVSEIIQKKIAVNKEKLRGLAVGHSLLEIPKVSLDEAKKEISVLSRKLEHFFLEYSKAHPEDFSITQHLEWKNSKAYQLKARVGLAEGDLSDSGWVCFDFRLTQGEGEEAFPHPIKYLHLEHPLIKRMTSKSYSHTLEHAVLGPVKEKYSKVRFSFVLELESYLQEERSLDLTFPIGAEESIHELYDKAYQQASEVLLEEREAFLKRMTPLVDSELTKIQASYEKQIHELEELIQTYEHKNKQLGADHYFLLIPKVKKHLKNTKAECEEVISLTKDKLRLRTEAWLFSIEYL